MGQQAGTLAAVILMYLLQSTINEAPSSSTRQYKMVNVDHETPNIPISSSASVNVMPRNIFEYLRLANERTTNMLVEMADMTKKVPLGNPSLKSLKTDNLRDRQEQQVKKKLRLDENIHIKHFCKPVMQNYDGKKDSKIVKVKVERRSIALNSRKESSDEECSTFSSKDEEYVMAVRDFKKFFKKRCRFVRQPWNNKKRSKESVMTRTIKVIEKDLDVATRIILLKNVQNHQKTRIKELLTEALGAIAMKKMMRRSKIVDALNILRETKSSSLLTSHTMEFDPKSYEGVFLGYSQNSKAYIVLNKHTTQFEESLNVRFDETPPPSKTSPLVDDDLDEEEAIKVIKKKNLENDIVDETLEIDEIVNITESRNHPIENVVGNLNQRTLGDESWIVAMQEELNKFIANDV
uniref:Retrovirus-related Pol polyprotein from transposon TNT 1-94 n=1 Tax=Tanacetum cinerariifolium TaxID=118510 RepID=A0A699GZB1_TANCI|nr:retrovirus-related Pol polyprotein from transposon TNT 1-94 [Tanacetum cinerariifolium]